VIDAVDRIRREELGESPMNLRVLKRSRLALLTKPNQTEH
jgi:hypothetical protein